MRRGIRIVFVLPCLIGTGLGMSSCTGPAEGEFVTPKGVWRSDGSGFLLDVSARKVTEYDVTATTCLKTDVERRRSIGRANGWTFDRDRQRLIERDGPEPFFLPYYRVLELPRACLRPVPNTVGGNFEHFAALFQAHYAFFDLYGVNWEYRVQMARERLRPDLSDAELLEVFAAMLVGIRDGHVSIIAELSGDRVRHSPANDTYHNLIMDRSGLIARVDEQKYQSLALEYLKQNVRQDILSGKSEADELDLVQYGILDGNVGYLAILGLAGFSGNGDDDPRADYVALEGTLDDVFQYFAEANVKAVIVDISFNSGGFAFAAKQVASRFTEVALPGISYQRCDARDVVVQSDTLDPSPGPGFHGPTYLVTSPATLSAGEHMALYMRGLPNVVHIGEPTNGILSEVLEKELPNGWIVGLSSHIARDQRGVSWEGIGIPPHISQPIFEPGLGFTQHAETIERLRQRISGQDRPVAGNQDGGGRQRRF